MAEAVPNPRFSGRWSSLTPLMWRTGSPSMRCLPWIS